MTSYISDLKARLHCFSSVTQCCFPFLSSPFFPSFAPTAHNLTGCYEPHHTAKDVTAHPLGAPMTLGTPVNKIRGVAAASWS